MLDPAFTWTDARGRARNKAEVLRALRSGAALGSGEDARGDAAPGAAPASVQARVYGQVGIVQQNRGKMYALRVWVKGGEGWRLVVYHAVATGLPASGDSGDIACENPCKTVPFRPRDDSERAVIETYQAVERAVTAHDSAAWGSHIAEEFFAVTSNSDRPLDKATRMAGLDNQKVAGIAPFPLASARMMHFGDAMIMVSQQQPERGLPLHVTRVWFKRSGKWLEAYSYQTTIQAASAEESK